MPEPLNGDGDLTIGAQSGAATPAPDASLQIPEVAITRVIGKGGMGVVYAGRQSYLDRDVAVKVLSSALVDPSFAERFRREAKILAGMTHPNVVACYSAGVTPTSTCYLVMELIDGPSLAQWLKEKGRLPPKEALAITRDVAGALDHAYQAKIIHRDVKPENVLLARRKGSGSDAEFPFVVKLADLGLARSTAEDASIMDLTARGAVLGTPTTMAPEQFEDPNGVDWRADIYGLGCVLFHCLTGRQAFPPQATLAATFTQKLVPKPPDPRELRADLDPQLAAFVMRLLAKRRDDRPQSYAEIVAECDRLVGGGARPAARRSPRLAIGAAALVLAGVATWAIVRPGSGDGGDSGGGTPSPPPAPKAKVALAVVRDGAELGAEEEVVEGTIVELAASIDPKPTDDTPSYAWTSVAPKKWPIADADQARARVELPRGLSDDQFTVQLAVAGATDFETPTATRTIRVARDRRVTDVEKALESPGGIDLPVRFPDGKVTSSFSDGPAHPFLGPGDDYATWSLPRGDWSLSAEFHLLGTGVSEDGAPQPTVGGIRIEFGDSTGVQIRAFNPDLREASDRLWSVTTGDCDGTTSAGSIDLKAKSYPTGSSLTLLPQTMIPLAQQTDEGPDAMQDVLHCDVRWSAREQKFTIDLEQRREQRIGNKWSQLDQPRKHEQWERTRSELDRDPAFLPCRLILWKTHGGICVHELKLGR